MIVMVSISIIMSTTSSCQTSIIKVVRKCNSSAAREYTWKHFRARNSAFFSGKLASMVAEVGSSFPRFRASIRESCRQKVHRTAARARFALQKILKKIHLRSTFERWGRQNVTSLALVRNEGMRWRYARYEILKHHDFTYCNGNDARTLQHKPLRAEIISIKARRGQYLRTVTSCWLLSRNRGTMENWWRWWTSIDGLKDVLKRSPK